MIYVRRIYLQLGQSTGYPFRETFSPAIEVVKSYIVGGSKQTQGTEQISWV